MINPLCETCHCGHDLSSHYRQFGAQDPPGACLCQWCRCEKYVYKGDPKPVPPPERPNHRGGCPCMHCQKWRAYVRALPPSAPVRDEERPTLPCPK